MIEIKNCPSSLSEGFDTYSLKSAKLLFGKTIQRMPHDLIKNGHLNTSKIRKPEF